MTKVGLPNFDITILDRAIKLGGGLKAHLISVELTSAYVIVEFKPVDEVPPLLEPGALDVGPRAVTQLCKLTDQSGEELAWVSSTGATSLVSTCFAVFARPSAAAPSRLFLYDRDIPDPVATIDL